MISRPQLLLTLFSFCCTTILAGNAAPTATTITQETCLTYYASTSQTSIKTRTSTTYLATSYPRVKYTSNPTTTVTPFPPILTTTTSTVTAIATATLPVTTDTFTQTDTQTSTDSTTTTTTLTETSYTQTTVTTANATPIYTVPTVDGFIYPTPTYGGAKLKRSYPIVKGRAEPLPSDELLQLEARNASSGQSRPPRYPNRVICQEAIETVIPVTKTFQGHKTVTSTGTTPTSTVTQSITITTTSTSTLADASTTVTTSTILTTTSTETDTATSTQTATQTLTATGPQATVYAQCNYQNTLSRDYGGNQLEVLVRLAPNAVILQSNSAYDCCNSCFASTNCAGANYAASLVGSECELDSGDACPANQEQPAVIYTSSTPYNGKVVISNGPCGYNDFTSFG